MGHAGTLEKDAQDRTILPFVRLSYASSSVYSWWDENGEVRTVNQAEGGEQGDPLMHLLFSSIQGALEEAAGTLEAGVSNSALSWTTSMFFASPTE